MGMGDKPGQCLDKIEETENLDDETFPKWCLLHSNLNHEELFTEQIERAAKWYTLHGTAKENYKIKIVRQKAVILSAVCICIALLVLLVYFFHKKRTTDRTQKQQSGICP